MVAVVGEAMDRGETSGGLADMSVTQWVRAHAPSTRAGGAGTVVAVAQAFHKSVNAPVKEAVDAGRLPVRSAAAVVSEFEKLRPLLADHTIVHTRRHAGRVVRDAHGERVEWDLTRGSYDQLLARRSAQEPA